MKQIETEVWVPNPENSPFMMTERVKTYKEVYQELSEVLKKEGVYDELDYFSNMMRREDSEFSTTYRWIACFAVEGGNEGHYIHIETISEGGNELIYLGKTFMGLEHALKVSNICTQAFYR
ncbi:hypothetical protein QTG56_24300 (plasmid) [Rossellomorea sp. AcN35-11]|nr:hypothetical protein [Rossellomorea aquimaris]WJV31762.1 hypothetical protein QTG56_24300 [Rossellomorea sp. AcN35-11]